MFLKIDDWLFNKVFQPFADWFCDRTGRNPFWLSATCLYVWIACVLCDNVLYQKSWFSMTLDALLIVLFGYLAYINEKNSLAPTTTTGYLNPSRKSGLSFFARIIFIITYPFDIINLFITHPGQGQTHSDVIDFLTSSFFILHLYFEACESKPPAPPKKKESTKLAHAAS